MLDPGSAADHPDSEEITMPLSTFLRRRTVVAGMAGLGLAGALAGCSTGTTTTSGSAQTAAPAPTSGTSTAAASGSYKDGTYSADGSYSAPSGTETITVTLTIASGAVTKVSIGTHATDPNAKQYQTMFAEGISGVVVGKELSSLSVSRVAGSSLTSGGFRAAVAKIEQQAAS